MFIFYIILHDFIWAFALLHWGEFKGNIHFISEYTSDTSDLRVYILLCCWGLVVADQPAVGNFVMQS
jgi:hypothetical protein